MGVPTRHPGRSARAGSASAQSRDLHRTDRLRQDPDSLRHGVGFGVDGWNDRLADTSGELAGLVREIEACRVCLHAPDGAPLPHEPRPVLRPSATARLAICSQAPGVRVHVSGKPFTDPSGDRLRAWLEVTPEDFYDQARVAIVPMGFCFPGHDPSGGDLPPRRECARTWHGRLFALMPQLELVLLVGSYAQRWHLGSASGSMTETVARWGEQLRATAKPRRLALPHPSWRNNAWLSANTWFERELLPELRTEVRRLLAPKA